MHRGLQVDVQDQVEEVVVQVVEHPVPGDPGVVDQDVQLAVLRDRAVRQLAGGGQVDGVGQADAGDAAGLLDQVGGLVRRLRVHVVDHDGRAVRGEPECGRPADPATRTGDDCDLAVQPAHPRPSRCAVASRKPTGG
jgi:hypothetical protein